MAEGDDPDTFCMGLVGIFGLRVWEIKASVKVSLSRVKTKDGSGNIFRTSVINKGEVFAVLNP